MSDLFAVIDLEATCEKDDKNYYNEIIEFPVVVICSKTKQVVGEFRRFVKPTINPILSNFCKELTGIQQESIDEADPFDVVMKEFFEWMIDNEFLHVMDESTFVIEGAKIITDGIWDIKKFISTELSKYTEWTEHLRMANSFFSEWIDLKKLFLFNYETDFLNVSIDSMLQFFGFSFDGRQHSGIDDARNISRIALRMMYDPIHFKVTDRIRFQCGDLNSKERYIRYSDDIFRNVTHDLKSLNKVLNLDAKHNPYASHNLFSSSHFVGDIDSLKYIMKGFLSTEYINIPYVFFSIRSQKKGILKMKCLNMVRTKYTFYEETSPQSDEFKLNGKSECTFRRSTFRASMIDFIKGFLSCSIDIDENVHVTLCLDSNYKMYLGKELIQKGYVQVKQQQKEFSVEEFLERINARSNIFSNSIHLRPPSDLLSMDEWIEWRLKLLTIRKHLNSIKLCRREELLSNRDLIHEKKNNLSCPVDDNTKKMKKKKSIDEFTQSNDCHYEFHMIGDVIQSITTHNYNLCW